jgi:hypothetical protein
MRKKKINTTGMVQKMTILIILGFLAMPEGSEKKELLNKKIRMTRRT